MARKDSGRKYKVMATMYTVVGDLIAHSLEIRSPVVQAGLGLGLLILLFLPRRAVIIRVCYHFQLMSILYTIHCISFRLRILLERKDSLSVSSLSLETFQKAGESLDVDIYASRKLELTM